MNKVKTVLSALLLILLCFFPALNARAAGLAEQVFISVKINGRVIFMDTNPYVKQQRTFVPVRFVAEAFGMNVRWNQDEKKAVLEDESTTVELWLDRDRLTINGEEVTMDVSVEGKNGRTMVPVRHLAEALGFVVEWDKSTYTVVMNKEDAAIEASGMINRAYTDEDIIWLSRIIHVEGLNLSVEGKVGIANVVLNRVKSLNFPGTVYEVIFDTRYSVQFPPAHRPGFTELVPDNSCVIAAKMALEGINNVDQCLFFNHTPFKNKSADLYKKIEGEYFYY